MRAPIRTPRARGPATAVPENEPLIPDVSPPLAGRIVGELRETIAELGAVESAHAAVLGLLGIVADALGLAYLDGLTDAATEDADELLDGRSRAERAAGKASDAGIVLWPLLESLERRTRELGRGAGVLWSLARSSPELAGDVLNAVAQLPAESELQRMLESLDDLADLADAEEPNAPVAASPGRLVVGLAPEAEEAR